MAEVALRSLVKRYDAVEAVRTIDLDIPNNEFVVLVGPSGCGKSTTLRMIAGLEEITSGEIYIGGEIVNDLPPKDRDIAMVFQNYALYPHMSAYENMSFGLRVQMRTEIKRVHQKVKTTTVYVTHDQVEAMTLADRVVVMNNGRIEQVGTPHDLYHHPKTRFVAGFIGSPAMNLMPCRLEQNGAGLRVRVSDTISLPVPDSHAPRYRSAANRDLVLGLRPEHLTEPRRDREAGCEFAVTLDVVEPLGMETM